MNVKGIVESLVRKYHTRDPYELADFLDIKIVRCELGKIRGYFIQKYRIKQIFLNHNLDRREEKLVLAHEIGHSIMHPDVNTPFLQNHTGFSTNKFEIEANKFAACLLIPDEVMLENCYLTTDQLSRLFGYGKNIIELRQDMYREIL